MFAATGSDFLDCVNITLAFSLHFNYTERYGTELVINIICNFLPLGSMQRKLGSFGGKAFHQVYVELFGSWLLEMTYTLLMVSLLLPFYPVT